jgi:hypothetical protein
MYPGRRVVNEEYSQITDSICPGLVIFAVLTFFLLYLTRQNPPQKETLEAIPPLTFEEAKEVLKNLHEQCNARKGNTEFKPTHNTNLFDLSTSCAQEYSSKRRKLAEERMNAQKSLLIETESVSSKAAIVWDMFDVVADCPVKHRIGGYGDGGKWLCHSKELYNCITYSFGSDGNIRYETDMMQTYGCESHIFDPTPGTLSSYNTFNTTSPEMFI